MPSIVGRKHGQLIQSQICREAAQTSSYCTVQAVFWLIDKCCTLIHPKRISLSIEVSFEEFHDLPPITVLPKAKNDHVTQQISLETKSQARIDPIQIDLLILKLPQIQSTVSPARDILNGVA